MGPPLCRRSLYSQCVCVCSRAQARQVADLRPRRGASATRPLHLGRGRLVCACARRAGARPERGGPLAPGAPVSRAGAAEVAARHDRRARRSLLPHVHSAGGPCHLPAQGARCGLPRILIYSTSVHANVRDAAHFRIAARLCAVVATHCAAVCGAAPSRGRCCPPPRRRAALWSTFPRSSAPRLARDFGVHEALNTASQSSATKVLDGLEIGDARRS